MRKVLLLVLLVLFPAGVALAAVPEIVGGVRDGAAIGLQLESSVARNLTLRGAIEFNSGRQPVVACLGGKIPLASLGRMPLGLALGLVGYFGNNSDVGFSLSFVLNRFFDLQPMFLELGVDVAGRGRLLAQIGYKVF
ncbi:hypothetical protein A3H38_03745 [candidate division WOR-1 bacterium RIFCSPLOWO2_02_FULL_46_20]|uniref:DUF5723 domain-containing protein n=1 Tax=candidate division WOR-1 bacterium RIFCSPLOWO2_02_FULL_46_20 TaxID=1802567 RepID=A0A1F4RHJ7_UNCSA|nr:MAG: hypothetical protein A3J44_00045 [candidate division WOR-1 bacterium RIFCSPHIGHO2_02_FULL_45_12]OGC07640.1 MAG: hypothetical protein A3H38_03745 [candidate division WOR-1 bacterium RIFCSPLOWO2_02_FULL_46_20]